MEVVTQNADYLLKAALNTVWLSLTSMAVSLALGTLIGVLTAYRVKVVVVLNAVGVTIVRGVPLLVALYFSYYTLPLLHLNIDAYSTAVIGLSLYFTFFMSEIIRGAVESIPRGQIDAAKAIGLSFWKRARLVVLPVAFRAALPPVMNVAIILVKGTAYASVISVWELTSASTEIAQQSVAPFQVYGFALAIYFVICFALTTGARRAEARLQFKY